MLHRTGRIYSANNLCISPTLHPSLCGLRNCLFSLYYLLPQPRKELTDRRSNQPFFSQLPTATYILYKAVHNLYYYLLFFQMSKLKSQYIRLLLTFSKTCGRANILTDMSQTRAVSFYFIIFFMCSERDVDYLRKLQIEESLGNS